MSIIVTGMEMPESCLRCDLFAGNGCKATRTIFPDWMNVAARPKGCPLRPLPEKHGRLKDSDSISADIKDMFCKGCVCSPTSFNCQLCKITKVLCIVDGAPTIVEAEGE